MAQVKNALIIIEVVLAVLLMAGVLLQTPKATGLGGTIGGGGDGLGGGYRTRSGRDVDSVIYQGLTTVNAEQNVTGLLATDWFISNDHLTYTFDMRTGVKWADGQPFTRDDVLFTFHVLQDLEYTLPGAVDWRQVGVAAGGPNQVV